MIRPPLASRDRRTAIVGGAVVLSLLVIGRGVPAWNQWRKTAQESTRAVVAEASEATASVNSAHDISAANKHAELQNMMVTPAFVNGSALATAAADLASVVVNAATANGVSMGSLQTSGDSASVQSGGVSHVRVSGEATGDVTAVTQFLAALESGFPLISVRELSVTQAEATAPANQPESLRVGFVMEALAHIDPPGRIK